MTPGADPRSNPGARPPRGGRWTAVYAGIVLWSVLLYAVLYWFTVAWNTPES